jgi:adenosylmethionine-8-amino-7-oxononanoate aminotransferase
MEKRREKYIPLLLDFPHISPAYCYRCPFNKEYPDCSLECAQELNDKILSVGPEKISAFIAEPVVGSACGATVPPPEYFPLVREICDRHGVLFIADEIITGLGRTGKNFGIDHWGIVPDMMTAAKSLSGGYSPLGAVILKDSIRQVFEEKSSAFEHIFTYGSNPLSTATARAVLDVIAKENLVHRSEQMGAFLFQKAESLLNHPIVGDLRGKGLLMGVELVQSQEKKTPFPAELRVSKRLASIALSKGLVIYPGGGCADGKKGDHFLICPPLTIREAECDTIIGKLDESLSVLERQLL